MQYQPRIAFGRQPGAPSAGQRGLERAATDLAVVGVVSVKQRKNQSRDVDGQIIMSLYER